MLDAPYSMQKSISANEAFVSVVTVEVRRRSVVLVLDFLANSKLRSYITRNLSSVQSKTVPISCNDILAGFRITYHQKRRDSPILPIETGQPEIAVLTWEIAAYASLHSLRQDSQCPQRRHQLLFWLGWKLLAQQHLLCRQWIQVEWNRLSKVIPSARSLERPGRI